MRDEVGRIVTPGKPRVRPRTVEEAGSAPSEIRDLVYSLPTEWCVCGYMLTLTDSSQQSEARWLNEGFQKS